MQIIDFAMQRRTTKAFDPSKKLTDEQMAQLQTLLQYAPSSTNSQPWHFIVAHLDEAKKRIAKSTEAGHVYNTPKILDASHVIVMCTKTVMDDVYLQILLEQETKDGGFHRVERSYGSFQRALNLPADANQDTIKAAFKNGVLTITMEKREASTPKQGRSIPING